MDLLSSPHPRCSLSFPSFIKHHLQTLLKGLIKLKFLRLSFSWNSDEEEEDVENSICFQLRDIVDTSAIFAHQLALSFPPLQTILLDVDIDLEFFRSAWDVYRTGDKITDVTTKSSDKEILEIVIDEGLGLADGWEGMFLNLVSYLVAFTYCRFDSHPRTKVKVILLRIRQ